MLVCSMFCTVRADLKSACMLYVLHSQGWVKKCLQAICFAQSGLGKKVFASSMLCPVRAGSKNVCKFYVVPSQG